MAVAPQQQQTASLVVWLVAWMDGARKAFAKVK